MHKDCEEVFNEVRSKGITTVDLSIRMKGEPGEDYPFDFALGDEQFTPRQWEAITYRWKASGLCHKPLYFQEASLERYGHTWGPVLQPFVSGAHFFFTVPMLPYAMGIQTPNECVYTLGYYRPGSCTRGRSNRCRSPGGPRRSKPAWRRGCGLLFRNAMGRIKRAQVRPWARSLGCQDSGQSL